MPPPIMATSSRPSPFPALSPTPLGPYARQGAETVRSLTDAGLLRRQDAGVAAPAAFSVVIPALNEESRVSRAIGSARDEGEVIVVDGGSRDHTREVAATAGARVVSSPPSRGRQLNHGARATSGAWLVFLHADTRLEEGWADALRRLRSDVVGGAFRFAVDSPRTAYRLVEVGVALRCRLLRLPYGDQALFARRGAYEMIGGFAPIPLMEDLDFVRRLRRVGPLAFPGRRAFTSPRRWERAGILRTTLRNWWLLALYAGGWSPSRLAALYEAGTR